MGNQLLAQGSPFIQPLTRQHCPLLHAHIATCKSPNDL